MLLLLSLLLACDSKDDDTGRDDGTAGDGGFDCGYTSSELPLTEPTPLGVTGQQWLAVVLISDEQGFRYTDKGTADTVVTLAVSSTTETVTAWVSPEDTVDDDDCDPYLEVGAALALQTADGAFDEAVEGQVRSAVADSGTWTGEEAYAERGGSYTTTEVEPDEWEELTLGFRVDLGAGGSEGSVHLSGHRTLPDGTGEGFEGTVATWPVEG
ncbi:hypothetical protein L6R53_08400 [Myxococcota bacterium]|nr:hypothetical protein [Myxococcota bacterium]